ncbi:MAG: hypothetical protein PSX36_05715 [bacterium]|nr:hypothetical protein [bacterium]
MNYNMDVLRTVFNKKWKINVTLFLCSFAIYFWHFHSVFLNINLLLSSITLDSIKNYYTFIYHIKNDPQLFHFSGMNYPEGEHIVYTDAQPLIACVLKLIPFAHNYLIGILHGLIFMSFIISPLILNKILVQLQVDRFSAFFFSLGIALLSPQFLKINAGHLALAYGCLIPYSILILLKVLDKRDKLSLLHVFVFNTLVFLIHPYMGFSLSLFTFLALFFYDLSRPVSRSSVKSHVQSLTIGILPIVLFKLFMAVTDHHLNRTQEPYGKEAMIENLDSVLAPVFGPFKNFMSGLFPHPSQHFEGHTYLGFFTILLSLAFLLLLPLLVKRKTFQKEITAVFLSSLVILFISFGIHIKLMNAFHVQLSTVNQFRAVCRFAWIFYYCLPLFVIVSIYHSAKTSLNTSSFRIISASIALLFFSTQLLEAHFMFKLNESAYWKFRNFFNETNLNEEEQLVLQSIEQKKPQAIIPLPIFHGGSELYERNGSSNSMIPTMLYSYHAGLPILSMMSSRTSMTETEDLIQILNSYKRNKPMEGKFTENDLLILKTKDALLPDEERLLPYVKFFKQNDTLAMGYLSRADLFRKKLGDKMCRIAEERVLISDSLNLIYLPFENRKPFLSANVHDFEKIFVLDSNMITPGNYVLSFRFYYSERKYQSLSTGLIVTEGDKLEYKWRDLISVRNLSGFYAGYGMFEHSVYIGSGKRYEFVLNGSEGPDYHISHFMLRPKDLTVLAVSSKNDTTLNNFQP